MTYQSTCQYLSIKRRMLDNQKKMEKALQVTHYSRQVSDSRIIAQSLNVDQSSQLIVDLPTRLEMSIVDEKLELSIIKKSLFNEKT